MAVSQLATQAAWDGSRRAWAALRTPGERPGCSDPSVSVCRHRSLRHATFRRRGEDVFRAGDPVTHFYCLLGGELHIISRAADGAEQLDYTIQVGRAALGASGARG